MKTVENSNVCTLGVQALDSSESKVHYQVRKRNRRERRERIDSSSHRVYEKVFMSDKGSIRGMREEEARENYQVSIVKKGGFVW